MERPTNEHDSRAAHAAAEVNRCHVRPSSSDSHTSPSCDVARIPPATSTPPSARTAMPARARDAHGTDVATTSHADPNCGATDRMTRLSCGLMAMRLSVGVARSWYAPDAGSSPHVGATVDQDNPLSLDRQYSDPVTRSTSSSGNTTSDECVYDPASTSVRTTQSAPLESAPPVSTNRVRHASTVHETLPSTRTVRAARKGAHFVVSNICVVGGPRSKS